MTVTPGENDSFFTQSVSSLRTNGELIMHVPLAMRNVDDSEVCTGRVGAATETVDEGGIGKSSPRWYGG